MSSPPEFAETSSPATTATGGSPAIAGDQAVAEVRGVPESLPRWTGLRAAGIGIAAAVATLLLFGELGSLVSAPHMQALRRGGKVYGTLSSGPKVTDPGYEIGSFLLLLYLIWWLASSVWVGVIVRRGAELYRVILPAIIEAMFLLILALLLP